MSQKLLYLCLCCCLFQACQKEALTLPTTFEVSIDVTHCINGGSLLSVSMPNPELYGYLWEVNDHHGGHDNQTLGCQCVETATVRVTRLVDGVRVDKSIELTNSCSSKESSF